jgi:hypothetical protein
MLMLASVFDTFRGLPTHILIVHAVVVLVPLCFVGVCVSAVSRKWRERLGTPILWLLGAAVVSAFIATRSGRLLRSRIGATPAINHHAHIGVWVPWFVLIALVLTALWLAVERRPGASRGLRLTACVLAVASCGFATVWVAYTGEAGSRATWQPIVESTNNK